MSICVQIKGRIITFHFQTVHPVIETMTPEIRLTLREGNTRSSEVWFVMKYDYILAI